MYIYREGCVYTCIYTERKHTKIFPAFANVAFRQKTNKYLDPFFKLQIQHSDNETSALQCSVWFGEEKIEGGNNSSIQKVQTV